MADNMTGNKGITMILLPLKMPKNWALTLEKSLLLLRMIVKRTMKTKTEKSSIIQKKT